MTSKHELTSLAKEAAKKYLVQKQPLNDTILKIAKSRDLNKDQVERLCQFANHSVNSTQMKKASYTDFDLASPKRVLREMNKTAERVYSFLSQDENHTEKAEEKTASSQSLSEDADLFYKIADCYDVKVAQYPASSSRFLKDVSSMLTSISDKMEQEKIAYSEAQDKLFQVVKEDLISGIPWEKVQQNASEAGAAQDLKAILPRLEAENLIPLPEYDDDGPHSVQRRLKVSSIKEAQKRHAQDVRILGEPEYRTYDKEADTLHGVANNLFLHKTAADYCLNAIVSLIEDEEDNLSKESHIVKKAGRNYKKVAGLWGSAAKWTAKKVGKGISKATKGVAKGTQKAVDLGYKGTKGKTLKETLGNRANRTMTLGTGAMIGGGAGANAWDALGRKSVRSGT